MELGLHPKYFDVGYGISSDVLTAGPNPCPMGIILGMVSVLLFACELWVLQTYQNSSGIHNLT